MAHLVKAYLASGEANDSELEELVIVAAKTMGWCGLIVWVTTPDGLSEMPTPYTAAMPRRPVRARRAGRQNPRGCPPGLCGRATPRRRPKPHRVRSSGAWRKNLESEMLCS